MLENIKTKKSFAAIMTLAFAALVTCGVAAPTYAVDTGTAAGSVINLNGGNGSSSSSSSSSTTTTTESSIPDTSAGTTTNPDTADDTWLFALASLAITAAAIGGRHYFAKH